MMSWNHENLIVRNSAQRVLIGMVVEMNSAVQLPSFQVEKLGLGSSLAPFLIGR